MENILEVKNLSVSFTLVRDKSIDEGRGRSSLTGFTGLKDVQALRMVSFSARKGEIIGVVGESGSGKSTLAFSLINLLPADSKKEGQIFFKDKEVFCLNTRQLERMRGCEIGMIFQNPESAFNPVLSIGYQFHEILKEKLNIRRKEERKSIIRDSFSKVRLSDCPRVMKSYPHQLSGGQMQRVSIAMAIALKPDLLIADEPTSSLDVTIESQIINLFKELRDFYNLTIIFITHNLDLVKVLCDRAVVIYQGEVKEIRKSNDLFISPKDRYTVSLIESFKELQE